jgi:1,4-dihydroxy-2-naphthoate polyprenyltransferase
MIKAKSWLSAFRLRTLPLSISGIIAGSFLAMHHGYWNSTIFGLAILTTLVFQILSNLANDLGDTLKGADNAHRVGPTRSVQSGAISIKEMRNAVGFFSILGLLSSGALIFTSIESMPTPILWAYSLLAVFCIVAAITYTLGKKAYGYLGLGDVFVFLFFGAVSVLGVYGLYTYSIVTSGLYLMTVFGALSVAVLNLNNMRDSENDAQVGKRTFVVKIGFQRAKYYHNALFLLAFLATVLFSWTERNELFLLLLLPFIIFTKHLIKVWNTTTPSELDPELKIVALSTFLIALIFMSIIIYL